MSPSYIEKEIAGGLVARLTIAGDNLAELIGESLATEEEIEEAVQGWERVRAEVGQAVGIR